MKKFGFRKLNVYLFCIVVVISTQCSAYASTESETSKKIIELINEINPNKYCELKKRTDVLLDFNNSSCVQSVVSIHVKKGDVVGRLNERPTLLVGSGVLIAPNLVLTNNHVINSRERLEHTILIVDQFSTTDAFYKKPKKIRVLLDDDSIFFTDPSMDFTIFEIVEIDRPIATGYKNASKYDLSQTYSISPPAGQGLRYTLPYEEKRTTIKGKKVTHYCHSFPGSSGSPLFDSNGYLIGIHRSSDVIEGRNTAKENYGVSYPSIIKRLNGTKEFYNEKDVVLTNKITESLESNIEEWSIESLLLGLPPGHEILTVNGIINSGIKILYKNQIKKSLINGNIDVDYPTYFGMLPRFIKIYQSHYGKNQYQHSMLTEDLLTYKSSIQNRLMHKKLFSYLEKQVNKFLVMNRIDNVQAARELGHIIHTIQDSYSPSHTVRNSKGIISFFYYGNQKKDEHSKQDNIFDKEDQYTKQASIAIDKTSKLLIAAYTNSGNKKQNIMRVLHGVFKLSTDNEESSSIKASKSSKPVVAEDSGNLEAIEYDLQEPNELESKSSVLYRIQRPIEGKECCPPPTYQ